MGEIRKPDSVLKGRVPATLISMSQGEKFHHSDESSDRNGMSK